MPATNTTELARLTAFTATTIACATATVTARHPLDGGEISSACTARLTDEGRIVIRHERNVVMSGTRAHKFAVATLEAVFAALRAEGIAFRVRKYRRADLGGKLSVWHFVTSGSGLSWAVDGQWAEIEILVPAE